MTDQNKRFSKARCCQNTKSSKERCCQAVGCMVDLKGLGKPYNSKKRLCLKHMRAEAITKKGSEGQWRFCQQCGTLEPLQQFEGLQRSCISGLRRRRDIHHAKAAAGKQQQQQQQQNCQAGEHLSGPSRQASSHLTNEHVSGLQGQASNSLSGLGLDAPWNPSLAATAAPHGVCYSSDKNSGRFLPMTTTPSISQDLVLSSPAINATESAAAAAAPMYVTAEVPYAAHLQGMAAAAAVSHGSNVCSQGQVPQQPVGLPGGWQPAAAATAAAAAWTAAAAPAAPGLSVEWQPAAAAGSTAAAAAVHPGFGMFQASPVDLQPWTAAAAAPSHGLWCTGADAANTAVLDEIEQQLLLAINTTQQQQAAAGQFAPAAAAGMPQPEQQRRELSRAATFARLQELSREFAALQQALQDGLAADLIALQCGQIAPQLQVQQQQQQQPAYGGGLGSTSMQSCGHVWQF